jgi:hypothetical protein
MENREFDRYVTEKTARDIVRHLRSIGLENLAFYVCELMEIKEMLEDHTLYDAEEVKDYLENAIEQDTFSDLVQDFLHECDFYTDDDDKISRDDMQNCRNVTFTKYEA